MSTGPLVPLGGTGPLAMPQGPSSLRSGPFINAAFARLWLAQASSTLGDRVHQLALMWWTIQATGSLAATGAVLIATTLPAVLLGPVAGALADRWPRKPLMIACDLARAFVTLALAGLAWSGQLSFPAVVAGSAVLACLTALFAPANMAMVPSVVEERDLLKANSLMETTMHGAGLLGPAIGGTIVAVVGAGGAFGLNALSFLLSAVALIGIAFPPPPPAAEREPFAESLRGGFRVLGAQPTIAGLLGCFAVLNFFSISVLLFLPHFAKTVFQVGATGLGFMEAAIAAGMLAGALTAGRLSAGRKRFWVIWGAIAGTCATFLLMGAFPVYGLHLALLAVTGALFGGMNVVVMAYFQTRVPAAEMGRFMGLLTSIVFGLMPVSNGVFGMLAGVIDPLRLLMINGAAKPLPQTEKRPRSDDSSFQKRVQLLCDAIVEGIPAKAHDAFFPLCAYSQVKAIADPERDYRLRLLAHFDRDILNYHRRISKRPGPLRCEGMTVQDNLARWMKPGSEYNRVAYFRVLRSRLNLTDTAQNTISLEVTSLISWRGQWYVVHLDGFE